MVAKRIPTIMPAPTLDEHLEILSIHSAAGPRWGQEFRRQKTRKDFPGFMAYCLIFFCGLARSSVRIEPCDHAVGIRNMPLLCAPCQSLERWALSVLLLAHSANAHSRSRART